jgi:hypothetical protein
MPNPQPPARRRHEAEVRAWLQARFGIREWALALPPGSGDETYLAVGGDRRCFVKVGAAVERAQAVAAAGVAPPVWAAGTLANGRSLLVQPYLEARTPRPWDFQIQLDQVAAVVHALHHEPGVRQVLPPAASGRYAEAGLARLAAVRARWEYWRPRVPAVAAFVDGALARLGAEIADFAGAGLVAAHGDICNANWLLTPAGRWYLVDLETLAWDDPAADLGPLLWWYYPPALRPRFLARAGYAADAGLARRLRARLALHCLAITLPRPNSWDRFDPAGYPTALTDFRAALAGDENPQGYGPAR